MKQPGILWVVMREAMPVPPHERRARQGNRQGVHAMAEFIVALIVLAMLAVIPAFVAESRGRSFVAWYFYGFFLWIVAVIHAACLRPNAVALRNQGLEQCPFCREWMAGDALVCPHCRTSHPQAQQRVDAANAKAAADLKRLADDEARRERLRPRKALAAFCGLVVFVFYVVYTYVANHP